MNLYFLQVVGKWVSLLVVAIASNLQIDFFQEKQKLENANASKNNNVLNQVIEYKVIEQYSDRYPYTTRKVIKPGSIGVTYFDQERHSQKVLKEAVNEIVLVGTAPVGKYTGRLTSYGPDCPGCSKVGNVACYTKSRTKHSLIYDGIYYKDDEFGSVRILAAAREAFPCGTIVKVDNGKGNKFYGVVLDTGGSMINAWEEGYVWMDLAFSSQAEARTGNMSGNNVSYEVMRWGW